MMDDYVKALLPEPYIILGRRLTSFTLGHHVVLTRMDAPILTGGDLLLTAADVIQGVMVCSQSWRQNVEMLGWDMDGAIRRFMRRDWLWRWRVRRIDWKQAIAMFIEWYQSATEVPVTYTEMDAKTATAPWVETTYSILAKQLGYTFEQVMDMPLPLAVYRTVALTEAAGGPTRLETEDDKYLRTRTS